MLMDEPFGALDIHTKESMQQFMLELWERTNITIFMITHDGGSRIPIESTPWALVLAVRKEISIKLPERTQTVKRNSIFHDTGMN